MTPPSQPEITTTDVIPLVVPMPTTRFMAGWGSHCIHVGIVGIEGLEGGGFLKGIWSVEEVGGLKGIRSVEGIGSLNGICVEAGGTGGGDDEKQ